MRGARLDVAFGRNHAGVPVAQEQILAREHRAESARSRKKQAAAEAAAGRSTVTGGNFAFLDAIPIARTGA